MNWIIPALLAPAVYAGVTFVDKYVVEKEVRDYRGMPIYGTVMGLIMGAIFWVATGFPMLASRDAFILLLTGAITIWSAALYFKAITLEDASNLILLFQMTPLIILVMSFFFLNERISLQQFIGFILILGSVLGVSDKSIKNGFRISKVFWIILIVDLMWAISAILIKFSINQNSFTEVLSYESWGIGLGGIFLYLLFPSIRNAFNRSILTVRKKALTIMFGNEALFVVGKSLTFFAYSLGQAALVSVIGSTEVFMGILLGIAVTVLLPGILKEDISRRAIIKKIILSFITFIGLVLVN